ncbi:uvrB-like protein [Pycnococcus provasolii]
MTEVSPVAQKAEAEGKQKGHGSRPAIVPQVLKDALEDFSRARSDFKRRMEQAALRLDFEEAAKLRDSLANFDLVDAEVKQLLTEFAESFRDARFDELAHVKAKILSRLTSIA